MFEFGETGLVIKKGDEVIAYPLGFLQNEVGYVHFVGVWADHWKQGFAEGL